MILRIKDKTHSHLLGQLCVLQACVPELAPEHGAPPWAGAGLVHDLDFDCDPPPHVLEQDPHDDHDE